MSKVSCVSGGKAPQVPLRMARAGLLQFKNSPNKMIYSIQVMLCNFFFDMRHKKGRLFGNCGRQGRKERVFAMENSVKGRGDYL